MQGMMQDRPLTLPHFFDRAERLFPEKEIVTNTPAGLERTHLRRVGRADPPARRRARPSSASPPTAGSARSRGTPPATSSCTSPRPCTGRVLHTLNIRLFPEQLTYIVNHAEDEVIFVDRSLRRPALAAARRRSRPCATSWSWTTGRATCPTRRPAASSCTTTRSCWPPRRPSSSRSTTRTGPRRCATRRAPPATPRASSTRTARPSCTRWARSWPTRSARRERDTILPVVPMFHANAWGLAHAAVACRRQARHARPRPERRRRWPS